MDIKIIVFDMDDSLYPERQFVESGFHAVGSYLKNRGISSKDLFPEMWKKFCEGARGTIFNDVLNDAGIAPKEDMVKEVVEVYRSHRPVISLYPDAVFILNHFHKKKKMGLLTDGYLQVQENKVKALEIKQLFNIIVFTDDIGGREYWKPHPAGYKIIMDRFSFSGKDCLYVGDNPKKDFFAARGLNWNTVQIKREEGIYKYDKQLSADFQADISIKDLSELVKIIK